MTKDIQELVIIGGGVMGLCTAYAAASFTDKITILEKSHIGDKQTASFGYTRSIRSDYLDPQYARLAYEARQLWQQIERRAGEPFLVNCGCLNIARESVTPDLAASYAEQSYRILTALHLKSEAFTRETLRARYPQFDADLGRLDVEAGFVYVPTATRALLDGLQEHRVSIAESAKVVAIERRQGMLVVLTDAGQIATRRLVITAGHGTNDVLARIEGCRVRFPISPDRPSQCKYFQPPMARLEEFTAGALPVFAYLDVGIYGHPIYAGKTPGVKIGYYNPPDVQKVVNTPIHDIASFVEECMPSLRGVTSVDVTDVDQCYYDLVADDNFILGVLPDMPEVAVGVGWRGTGYKYAPWVGQTLMQLALQEGSVYDINRFAPGRFVELTTPLLIC